MLWSRRAPAPPLPLDLPRRDGSTWRVAATRPSFAASTCAELATRRAFEPTAALLAGELVDAVLAQVDPGVSAQDAPHLEDVLRTAARLGVGLGLVEAETLAPGPGLLDPAAAGALGIARRGLPVMPPEQALLGAWFLLAGHHLARQEPDDRPDVLRALVAEAART